MSTYEQVVYRAQQVYFPRVDYCTDNAAMIAYQAYLQLQKSHSIWQRRIVMPRGR